MTEINNILLTKEQAKEIVDKNVYGQILGALNSLIADKVKKGIVDAPLGAFADEKALTAENQAKGKEVLDDAYGKFVEHIPAGGITVEELRTRIEKMNGNLKTRNGWGLELKPENRTSFYDPNKFSDTDLDKLSKVSAPVNEDALVIAHVKIPEEKTVLVAAPKKTEPKKLAAKPKTNTTEPKVEEPASAVETTEAQPKDETKEKEEEAKRIAEAQKRVEEEYRKKLADAGITGNTETVAATEGKSGGFDFSKIFGKNFGEFLNKVIKALGSGGGLIAGLTGNSEPQQNSTANNEKSEKDGKKEFENKISDHTIVGVSNAIEDAYKTRISEAAESNNMKDQNVRLSKEKQEEVDNFKKGLAYNIELDITRKVVEKRKSDPDFMDHADEYKKFVNTEIDGFKETINKAVHNTKLAKDDLIPVPTALSQIDQKELKDAAVGFTNQARFVESSSVAQVLNTPTKEINRNSQNLG